VSARARNYGGFTLIELVVVVALIALLAGFALDRLLPLIGRAQRVAFLQLQQQLQSALLLEAAERITAGEAYRLSELDGANPMTLLLQPPGNYLGSIEWPDREKLPRDSWYYDVHAAHLVYRVGRYTRFDGLDGPPDRVEFKVDFIYRDRDGDAVFDAARDHFDGLRLAAVQPYSWPD
jgi:prepilin-type N-terminal cleavage/methylation domain-containing protein